MDSKKIAVVILPSGLVECREASCQYRRSCANHTTAGNSRIEDGFRPELFHREEDGTISCFTIRRPQAELQTVKILPSNYHELQLGYVSFNNLPIIRSGQQLFLVKVPSEVSLLIEIGEEHQEHAEMYAISRAERIVQETIAKLGKSMVLMTVGPSKAERRTNHDG